MLHFQRTIEIAAPLERVFAFHLDTRNAARIAPPFPRVRVGVVTTPPTAGVSVQCLTVSFGIVSFPWDALVTTIDAPTLIEDVQERGPFAAWRHRHAFVAVSPTVTRLTDEIWCTAPWWMGGRLGEATVVRWQLLAMFAGRQAATKRLLEDPTAPVWVTPSHQVDQAAARALGVDSTGRTRQTGMFVSVTAPPVP